MRCEGGCTRLNGTFSDNIEEKREDLQCIQGLVPHRRLSLDMNICGLDRCLRVGYSDEQLPLKKRILFDSWYIIRSDDYVKD